MDNSYLNGDKREEDETDKANTNAEMTEEDEDFRDTDAKDGPWRDLLLREFPVPLEDMKRKEKWVPPLFSGIFSRQRQEPGDDLVGEDDTDSSSLIEVRRFFDVASGTSTGSIMAAALSRLHLSPDQILVESFEISRAAFPQPYRCNILRKFWLCKLSPIITAFWNGANRFGHKGLEDYLKKKLSNAKWSSEKDEPELAIFATKKSQTTKHTFYSKDEDTLRIDGGDGQSNYVEIWEAIRASTAAPTYFKSMCIDGKKFIDGGLKANCPVLDTIGMSVNSFFKLH